MIAYVFLAGAFFSMSAAGVYAFLSDRAESKKNGFYAGYLETAVEENWHTVTVDPSSLEGTTVEKEVKFRNQGNVPCYIRASVVFSSSDYQARLVNTKNKAHSLEENGWMKGEDGYYYYLYPVRSGEETAVLFDRIQFGKIEDTWIEDGTSFKIIVNEESVAQQHGDLAFASCQEAWKFHLDSREG